MVIFTKETKIKNIMNRPETTTDNYKPIPDDVINVWKEVHEELRSVTISMFCNEKQCSLRTRIAIDMFCNPTENGSLSWKIAYKSDPVKPDRLRELLHEAKIECDWDKIETLYDTLEKYR